MSELTGKTAVVTGAGRGLGREICRVLAEAGATVYGADLRDDLLGALPGAVPGVTPLKLDITHEGKVGEALAKVTEEQGRLDILVNNAGFDVTLPIDELKVEDWDRVIGVNLRGPFLMSRAALPLMKKGGSGSIVNIASTASKRAWANASAYHASKWGLLGFSHALHVEARPSNIKVTALVSGGMRTPFLLDRFPDIDLQVLQDPLNVAKTVRFVLSLPAETVIPEIMVIPMKETSWP